MRTTLSGCLAGIVAAVLATVSAQAQSSHKTFVSSTGNDANNCATETTPCRTLQEAHDKTSTRGVLTCLDNGEFSGGNTTTISKSITIDCTGTGASVRVTVAGQHSIVVAGVTSSVIDIRGLKISNPNNVPIRIAGTGAAASIRVEGCDLVANDQSSAIFLGTAGSTNILELLVVNTTMTNGLDGITLNHNGGGMKATLDGVRIFNNANHGIHAFGTLATTAPGLRLVVKNSIITGNTNQGILAQSTNGTTRVFVEDSVIAQNGAFGLQANGAPADFIVSRSTITHNNVGLSAINGGRLFTYGNNGIHGNVSGNGAFTGLIPLQ